MVTLQRERGDFRHANRDGKRDVGSLPIHTGLRIHQTRGGKPEADYGFRGIPGEGRGNDLQLSSGSDGNRLFRPARNPARTAPAGKGALYRVRTAATPPVLAAAETIFSYLRDQMEIVSFGDFLQTIVQWTVRYSQRMERR